MNADDIKIDPIALGQAIDAGNDAAHAGFDNQAQLEAAIKAYIAASKQGETSVSRE